MKNKTKNSIIRFTNEDIKTVLNCFNVWITQKSPRDPDFVTKIVNAVNLKTSKSEEILYKCLNIFMKICDETDKSSENKYAQDIVDFIKLKTSKNKDVYKLKMNFYQLSYIHDVVAQDCLLVKTITKQEGLNVCENIECIIDNNYESIKNSIMFPVIKWKYEKF